MKSLWLSPASLTATHWKRAVSETWARETSSRWPLAATRSPSPWLIGFPSLYHLEMKQVWQWCIVCMHKSTAAVLSMQPPSQQVTHVTTGAGVPVAWHSSSKGPLIITVLCVITSAPSMKGGTSVGKRTILCQWICLQNRYTCYIIRCVQM